NHVGGDVRGRVDHLKLDGAQIGGNLDFTSDNQVQVVNGARVAGTTTRHTPTDGNRGNGFLDWLRELIGVLALGLILIFLLPGIFVLTVLGLLPVLGGFIGLAAVIFGAGALALVVSQRPWIRQARI